VQGAAGPQKVQSDEKIASDDKLYNLIFNLYLMTYYQASNIAEAYLTQAHLRASKISKNFE